MRMFKQGDLVQFSEHVFCTKGLQHGIYRINNISDDDFIILTPVNPAIAQKLCRVLDSRYITVSAGQILLYNKGCDVNGTT